MLLDFRGTGITGRQAERNLDSVRITVNKNSIPFDTEKPTITSGIRIGTPAVTTRGMKEAEMIKIAELIDLTLKDFEANREKVMDEVKILCDKFPIY
jgi:glycine hydroxymethyltransferase